MTVHNVDALRVAAPRLAVQSTDLHLVAAIVLCPEQPSRRFAIDKIYNEKRPLVVINFLFMTQKKQQEVKKKMNDLTALFCSVDDFWNSFESSWKTSLLADSKPITGPNPELSISEMMTIVILFHQSNYRTFKHFYAFVFQHLRREFPNLISYNRFVHIKKKIFIPLFAYLLHRRGSVTGISFGWFYGFKLHLIVNEKGEILSFLLTPGNIADVSVVETLSRGIFGKLFGDKGYISAKLVEQLVKKGLHLFTTIRSNMKQKLIPLHDKILLRKRSIIETINDQLKNISQVEHTRHRTIENFLVNGWACCIFASTKKTESRP